MNTDLLFTLLQMKRPFGTEYNTAGLILPEDSRTVHHVKDTELMCIQIDTCENPTTMFTCHLDTVEHERGYKQIEISTDNIITVKGGGVLGADDAAGIALLVHMIENGVKGRFMFFSGEERGGVGSSYICNKHPELFSGISRAIAFDRKGVSDVVVMQTGEEGCSNKFSLDLCDTLTATTGYLFEPAIGVYTDTAEMFHLVPECCNVSVGYLNEHTAKESLDLAYLTTLSEAVLHIDWDSLPTVRKPVEKKRYADFYEFYDKRSYGINPKERDVDEILDMMQLKGVTITDLLNVIKIDNSFDLI